LDPCVLVAATKFFANRMMLMLAAAPCICTVLLLLLQLGRPVDGHDD